MWLVLKMRYQLRRFAVVSSSLIWFLSGFVDGIQSDDVRSAMEYIYNNSLAIERFDVVITEHFFRTPVQPDDENLARMTEWEAKSRVIVDYKAESLFYLRHAKETLVPDKNEKQQSVQETWQRVHFANGAGSYIPNPQFDSTSLYGGLLPLKNKDLASVMGYLKIPPADFFTIRFLDAPLGMNREEWVERCMFTEKTASAHQLPDGTTIIKYPLTQTANRNLITLFLDPKTRMPRRKTAVDGNDYTREVIESRDLTIGEINGIFVVTSMNVVDRSMGLPHPKTQRLARMEDTGVVDIDWLQINSDKIVIPSATDVSTDKSEWMKWLTPERK